MHWAYNVKKNFACHTLSTFAISTPAISASPHVHTTLTSHGACRFVSRSTSLEKRSYHPSYLISSYLIGTQFRLNGARSKACQFKAASTNHTRLHHLPVLRSDDELGCFRAGSDKMRSDGMSDINAPESTAQ